MLRKVFLVAAAAAATLAPAHANGIFLASNIKIDRKGTGPFADQIELLTLDWGVIASPSRIGGGSLCEITQITVTKDIDGASIDLIDAAVRGAEIGTPAIITLTRDFGFDPRDPAKEYPVLELRIERAGVVSYETAVSNQSLAMAETIRLASAVAKYSARAFDYNEATGKLLRVRDIPITCGQASA